MYAHQVIEDIKKTHLSMLNRPGITKNQQRFKDMLNMFINELTLSQKFHMGDGDKLYEVCNDEGDPLFEDVQYLKLPYKSIWIDCTMPPPYKNEWYANEFIEYNNKYHNGEPILNTREGILCIKLTDTVWLTYTATYVKQKDSWSPGLFPIIVFIGGVAEYKNREMLREMLRTHNIPFNDNLCNGNLLPWPTIDLPKESILGMLKEQALNLKLLEHSLKLINCKNISSEIIHPPAALNKKRRKQGKQPIFDYHVLNVVVPSAKKGYQGKTEPLSHNRVHLCRGHFKEYTEEHPLFGKYTGLYWWQPHVRGQNKDGIVMKDYNVTTK